MTDALTTIAGTSDILNQAQPTPEAAAAQMEVLKQDPEFMKRATGKDPVAFSEYNKLWRIAHGMPGEPYAPINEIDVMTQSRGRELADTQTHAEGLRQVGFTETQIYEYLNGRPMPLAERQGHEREKVRLEKDKAFIQRYLDGDPDARYRMRLVHAALSMPVGTQEQISEWERAHAGRKPI